jgi:indolepyruvate ferredoxin oxidoreductase beta subunit
VTTNVLFAGVGGQGIVTAGDILALAALRSGLSVKKAETHGMAQRGGSVVSHVRFRADGPMWSPLIPDGEADFLVAFEMLEGVRFLPMLRSGGAVIADERQIAPQGVAAGTDTYPTEAASVLASLGVVMPATDIATALGEPRAANAVLLGALSCLLAFPREPWEEAFRETLKPKALATGLEAFARGQAWVAARAAPLSASG